MPGQPPSDLIDYVRASDPARSWRVVRTKSPLEIDLVSQVWRGQTWRHVLQVFKPERPIAKESAILTITGWDPNPLDAQSARELAEASGLPVAMLFHIPNQPMFELDEDDLIAHTFVRHLDSGEADWPLLLPMTKSAIAAMDALQEIAGLSRFVATGASKRGWTSWLAAATGDQRVVGIAPMVYDNLNIPAQLAHQREVWNDFSPRISPYTSVGLHESAQTEAGGRLMAVVDPFTYREALTLPKLIVNGTNDPYWTVDALSLYWNELPGPKWASIVPNAGHGLGDQRQANEALAAFARACAGKAPMPSFDWVFEANSLKLSCRKPFPTEVRLWVADSSDQDFRQARWGIRAEAGPGAWKGEVLNLNLRLPDHRTWIAVLGELRFEPGFSLTTTVSVMPPR